MHKYPVIRTIYLYLFSLVGLVLIIIASVDFIDMALKAFVFKQAEADQAIMYKEPRPAYPPMEIAKTQEVAKVDSTSTLTADEKTQLRAWITEYKQFDQEREKIDYVMVRRQQQAAHNIAMLLVGFPLYLYHWGVIRKESKEKASA